MVLIQIKCMLLKSIFSLEYKVEILHNEILIDLFSLLLCLTYWLGLDSVMTSNEWIYITHPIVNV